MTDLVRVDVHIEINGELVVSENYSANSRWYVIRDIDNWVKLIEEHGRDGRVLFEGSLLNLLTALATDDLNPSEQRVQVIAIDKETGK